MKRTSTFLFLSLNFIFCLSWSSQASASWYSFFDQVKTVDVSGTEIKAGVIESSGKAKANLIYLHGFADTMDNHRELLTAFAAQGIRVIAFDYPGHGQSGGDIAGWGLMDLAQILPTLLNDRELADPNLPLILAGWSTGATIAIRIAQSWNSHESVLPRGTQIAGVIAFAPALPAKIVLEVDERKLTDGKMKHGPKPESVPLLGQFAPSITFVSRKAALSSAPTVPVFLLVAGNADAFADSVSAVKWARKNRGSVTGFQCGNAKHGIEFEPNGVGSEAISLAAKFAGGLSSRKMPTLNSRKCGKL